MKTIHTTWYLCDVCGRKYDTPHEAEKCESIPVREDKGVKVGDIIRITAGEGRGRMACVTDVKVHEPGWGPPAYDHTVFVLADVIDSWGSRQLSFDSYEVVHE